MSAEWMRILKQQVAEKGGAAVSRELGVSPTTISLVLGGKYPASTLNIEAKIKGIYGDNGMVSCPILGAISPDRCATNWERAKKIGVRLGDPAKIRLYKSCLKCSLRNN